MDIKEIDKNTITEWKNFLIHKISSRADALKAMLFFYDDKDIQKQKIFLANLRCSFINDWFKTENNISDEMIKQCINNIIYDKLMVNHRKQVSVLEYHLPTDYATATKKCEISSKVLINLLGKKLKKRFVAGSDNEKIYELYIDLLKKLQEKSVCRAQKSIEITFLNEMLKDNSHLKMYIYEYPFSRWYENVGDFIQEICYRTSGYYWHYDFNKILFEIINDYFENFNRHINGTKKTKSTISCN